MNRKELLRKNISKSEAKEYLKNWDNVAVTSYRDPGKTVLLIEVDPHDHYKPRLIVHRREVEEIANED